MKLVNVKFENSYVTAKYVCEFCGEKTHISQGLDGQDNNINEINLFNGTVWIYLSCGGDTENIMKLYSLKLGRELDAKEMKEIKEIIVKTEERYNFNLIERLPCSKCGKMSNDE